MSFDPDDELEGGSALRLDEGQFFATITDDYCLPAPSHPTETDRLDYLHEVYKYTVGNVPDSVANFLNDDVGRRILDVGCGTGKWAMEMAEEFPQCQSSSSTQVTGVDLVHPPIAQLPNNFDFRLHDITKGQQYVDDTFDLVHIRDLHAGMHDYERMLTECVRVLKPSGFLLVKEIEWKLSLDGTDQLLEDRFPHLNWLVKTFRDALIERQLDPWVGVNLNAHIRNIAGLQNISYDRIIVPLTPWHEDEDHAYTGRSSQLALFVFGSAVRIMLKDHGEPCPDQMFEAALHELSSVNGKLLWAYGSIVARKAEVESGRAN